MSLVFPRKNFAEMGDVWQDLPSLMAGQPTHWFPLIRPAIKTLISGGGTL